ncbi:MAG TPA: radical SAM protein [Syntrophobacteraceae bacterium]|nr:radical SAM protein [Syntrophobacteraceae bacterium]
MILLINPPLVKPTEPPPGVARLYGTLRAQGAKCAIIDANIEGILHLIEKLPPDSDSWTRRAVRNRERNLELIRSGRGYLYVQRYKRAVSDLNRLIGKCGETQGSARLTLSDYQHPELSPVCSTHLLEAAKRYEDNPFHGYFSKRIPQAIESYSPDLVGISLNYLSQALTAFSIAGFIRARYGGVRIVMGGSLITSWAGNPRWTNPFSGFIDEVVSGPGEQPLLESAGIDESVKIRRFSYDPFPVRDYLAPGPIVCYSASCGCYWNRCAFCPEKSERVRYEPVLPRRAALEAAELCSGSGPALLHFVDSALSPALLSELTESPPGVPWYGFARVTKRLADGDFCRALKRSGCVMLKLGLESGDQGVIDSEGKGIDLGVASRALASLKGAGIGTYVYLLFGTPSESEHEARNTLDFTVRHAPFIDFLNLAIFNMPVNSPEAQKCKTYAHYEGDLSLYTGFSHPRRWDRPKVRRFLDSEFKRHPAIAGILSNEPPFFTSNHAAFFC